VVDAASGLKVLIAGDVGSGSDARVTGTLAKVGECLGLESAGSFAAIWPNATKVIDAESLEIELPDGDVLKLGDGVEGAGGYLTEPLSDGYPKVPSSCSQNPEIVVIAEVRAAK
jgi:hypothetical protein